MEASRVWLHLWLLTLLMIHSTAHGAFLQSALPLEVTLTTPAELLSNATGDAIVLDGEQSITVGEDRDWMV